MGARNLVGARVLITGGTSGIGRALAVALAGAGARVVATGTGPRSVAGLAAAHPEIMGVVCDLTNGESMADALDVIRERLGQIDILVNNAGVQVNGVFSPDPPMPLTDIDREIAVNLTGPVKLTQLALPLLAAGGAIVNVSSGTAWTGKPDGAVYSATKAGLTMFSRVLRRQLAPLGIDVVTAYPPVTATAMTAARSGAFATATAVAAAIVRGLARGDAEIVVGRLRLLRAINRFAPGLAEAIVARQG